MIYELVFEKAVHIKHFIGKRKWIRKVKDIQYVL